MAKSPPYQCKECGYRSPKWLGRCPQCHEWDSFEIVEEGPKRSGSSFGSSSLARRKVSPTVAIPLSKVRDEGVARRPSGLELFDRVLGGGVVSGAATLVAGEPGIGKSTLMLQLSNALAAGKSGPVLYVSAEESPRQLRLRAERLGALGPIAVAGETELEPILELLDVEPPSVILVDSIQAVRSLELSGPPGSVGQVRFCAEALVTAAKAKDSALFLIGHVTKDGGIAGPKALEHLVDTVLTFEGEGTTGHRVLRAQKNRFGPTGEVAIYQMRDTGLLPVLDPSRLLVAERRRQRPGSAVLSSLHGTRPLLVEVQALVHPSPLPTPRRMTVGLDSTRATLLTAVLERFAGLSLAGMDLFLNAVGGLAVREPAADLAVAAALVSAARDRPLPPETAFFGEVGLLGEVRPVSHTGPRLREMRHLGIRRAIVPLTEASERPKGLDIVEIDDIEALAEACF
ncbi:MAG: DNA repair protein RadA [Acidobacteriota bacterium]